MNGFTRGAHGGLIRDRNGGVPGARQRALPTATAVLGGDRRGLLKQTAAGDPPRRSFFLRARAFVLNTLRGVEPATQLAAVLGTALTETFGPSRRYLDFASWPLGDDARVHVHVQEDRCDFWVSDRITRSPRLLASVSTEERIPAAIQALKHFAADQKRRRSGQYDAPA
jgi:hypothetical protein